MKNPLLSICIPTYNRGDIVYNTVCNIIEYQGNEIEVIISDNASVDYTEDKIRSLKDDRIIYYRNSQNMGFVYNLIKVIENANADFVFLLSDEDDIRIDAIPSIIDIIRKEKDLSLILGSINTAFGKKYLCYKNEKISNHQDAFVRFGFTHHYMTAIILNIKQIDFSKVWKEYQKFEHGYLDIYPQVYLLNLLLFEGNIITRSDIYSVMREKGTFELEKFAERPYVHPISRINLFTKNAQSLSTYQLKKDTYIKIFNKLYIWAVREVYFYHDQLKHNNKYKKYFHISENNIDIHLHIKQLKKISNSILIKSNLNESEVLKLNKNITQKYFLFLIKRKMISLLKIVFGKQA